MRTPIDAFFNKYTGQKGFKSLVYIKMDKFKTFTSNFLSFVDVSVSSLAI